MQVTTRLLTAAEAPQWDALVERSPQGSLFAERWWLEIVTEGRAQLLGAWSGERLVGALPLWPVRTLGVSRLRQPRLTPYWGPLLAPLDGKYSTQLTNEMTILRALAQGVTDWADISLQFHPTLANWLPFAWEGFGQSTRYTYRIPNLAGLLAREDIPHKSIRKRLLAAREAGLEVVEMVEPAVVATQYEKSLARQGLAGAEAIQRWWAHLADTAMERGCMKTFAAVDRTGQVHAATAMAWDSRCAYALFGGADPHFRASGAGTLLQWHELETAARLVPAYDFEGSMLEPVEQFFRLFGGELCSYLRVTRTAWPLEVGRRVTEGVAGWRRGRMRPRATRREPVPDTRCADC
jgi:hypothetical protein